MATNVSHDIPQLMQRAQRSLDAARLLADSGYAADAVSRAYYAMFYAATALLHSEDIAVSKHSAVIAQVGQRFARTGRISTELHRSLIDMFDERQMADYAGASFTQERAETAWGTAHDFVIAVERYLSSEGFLE